MLRYHCKIPNNVKYQASVFSPKSTSPREMFANENDHGELQDIEFKKMIINFIKEDTRINSMKLRRENVMRINS